MTLNKLGLVLRYVRRFDEAITAIPIRSMQHSVDAAS
jgi:hypothetical protein